jgi:Phosphate-selective porin O and P
MTSALLISSLSGPAMAADANDPEVAELRQQVQALAEQVKALQTKLDEKASAPAAPPARETKQIAEVPAPTPAPEAPVVPTTDTPDFSRPISNMGLSRFNPEISAAFDFVGSYASQNNNANFIMRDAEIMVKANVDEVARAYAVFNAETELDPQSKTENFSDASLGMEEAAVETTSLPYGLGVKAGQFFADFSRLGKIHSHDLPFIDRPASLEGILGGETKSRGVEVNWNPPIDHYVKLTLGAVDGIGAESSVTQTLTKLDGEETEAFDEGSHRSGSDMMLYGRAATIFEVTDSVSLNTGIDHAEGQDGGNRKISSGDFKLTWLPDAASYDRLEVGGEYLWGSSGGDFTEDALFGATSGSASTEGGYVYANYRIGKEWEPGVRFDVFHPRGFEQLDQNNDGTADGLGRTEDTLKSYSAYLGYNISEFNRVRVGVSYLTSDAGAFNGEDHDWIAFLQWTVVLGPHKHAFQP